LYLRKVLTKKAKYALNALVYLSRGYKSAVPKTADRIASDNNIPKKFLESILVDLKKVGILISVHGKGGGYLMRKRPEEISMVEIIRMFDGAVGLIPCATHQFFKPCVECKEVEQCKIRWTFKELRDLNVEYLKDKTINDLI
jgi:Rrf2 family protein